MTYTSFLPPALCKLNGKLYVVPGYHEVPLNTTLEEVFKNWSKCKSNPAPGYGATTEELDIYLNGNWSDSIINKLAPDVYETAESSRTGETYDVVRVKGNWSCSCKGFSFKRNCKHIVEMKKKYE